MTIKDKSIGSSSQSSKTQQPAYSIETVSKQVAIRTESGGTIILTDPDISALEFPSWGDIADFAKKIKDLISTGPTFPTDGGGTGGDVTITIVINGGTVTIPVYN